MKRGKVAGTLVQYVFGKNQAIDGDILLKSGALVK